MIEISQENIRAKNHFITDFYFKSSRQIEVTIGEGFSSNDNTTIIRILTISFYCIQDASCLNMNVITDENTIRTIYLIWILYPYLFPDFPKEKNIKKAGFYFREKYSSVIIQIKKTHFFEN